MENPKKHGTGFVAGTLVHTKEGLKPIEQIKVGDLVLSKQESGEGELSYQRVMQTFVHENQPLLCVDVVGWTVEEGKEAELTNTHHDVKKSFPLVVTANHPFWVVGKGWLKAEEISPGKDILLMENGAHHCAQNVSVIIKTLNNDIGWLIGGVFCPIKWTEEDSFWVDLSNSSVYAEYEYDKRIPNEGVEWWKENEEDRLKRIVYNIEVENFHTYYVGEMGIWVSTQLNDL